VWEINPLNELLMTINSVALTEAVDSWGWRPEKGEAFSVKSTYEMVSAMILPRVLVPFDQELAFKVI
jgi:hypothetical protein